LYLLCTDEKTIAGKLFYEPSYRDSKGNEIELNRLRKIANIYLYAEQVRTWTKQEVSDLIERGYLEGDTATEIYPDMLTPTQKTKDMITGDPYAMTAQLWKLYPDYFYSNGNQYPAKTPALGAEALLDRYVKIVKQDPRLHKLVMDVLRELIKTNSVSVGIEKFVLNRYWEVEHRRLSELKHNTYGTNIL